jgi:hypothetical protein
LLEGSLYSLLAFLVSNGLMWRRRKRLSSPNNVWCGDVVVFEADVPEKGGVDDDLRLEWTGLDGGDSEKSGTITFSW